MHISYISFETFEAFFLCNAQFNNIINILEVTISWT
jgi:hypothetical protein